MNTFQACQIIPAIKLYSKLFQIFYFIKSLEVELFFLVDHPKMGFWANLLFDGDNTVPE